MSSCWCVRELSWTELPEQHDAGLSYLPWNQASLNLHNDAPRAKFSSNFHFWLKDEIAPANKCRFRSAVPVNLLVLMQLEKNVCRQLNVETVMQSRKLSVVVYNYKFSKQLKWAWNPTLPIWVHRWVYESFYHPKEGTHLNANHPAPRLDAAIQDYLWC
jgi:hypothetical protein